MICHDYVLWNMFEIFRCASNKSTPTKAQTRQQKALPARTRCWHASCLLNVHHQAVSVLKILSRVLSKATAQRTCKRERYTRSAGQDCHLFSEGLLQSLVEGENFCIRLAVPVFGTAACVKQPCTQQELGDACIACIAMLGTSLIHECLFSLPNVCKTSPKVLARPSAAAL